MKKILTLVFVLCCSLAFAQSDNFIKMVNKVDEHIKKNQWDEIVLLAPDLIIEEPNRGEGYYYLGFAFHKLNNSAKATEYLDLATPLADEKLKIKINELRGWMQSGVQIANFASQAAQLQKQEQLLPAAEAWQKAWELNKSNLEYALNAVTNYINLKDYPAALTILIDSAVKSDPEAVKLINRLNETGQMKATNGYNNAMSQGISALQDGNFASAFAKFELALAFRPNDQSATDKKNESLEEMSWKDAKDANTLDSYTRYLRTSTLRKYQGPAHDIVQRTLISLGEKAAEANDVDKMELYLNQYLKDYPNGASRDKVKDVLYATYSRLATNHSKTKSAISQKMAMDLLTKASPFSPNKSDVEQRLAVANKLFIRYGRPDRTFLTFTYDSLNTFGLTVGGVKTKGLGMYFTLRANSLIFTALDEAKGSVDNSGNVDGTDNDGGDWRFKNEVKQASAEALLGLTHKITYPLWVFVGGGVSYTNDFWNMDFYENRVYQSSQWLKNSEEYKVGGVFEAGLMVDYYGVNLRAGIKTNDFKKNMLTFGIGLSFK